jgi:hypothetical protein
VLVSPELDVTLGQQVRKPGVEAMDVCLGSGMNRGITVRRFRVAIVAEQGDTESALRVGWKVPHGAAV